MLLFEEAHLVSLTHEIWRPPRIRRTARVPGANSLTSRCPSGGSVDRRAAPKWVIK